MSKHLWDGNGTFGQPPRSYATYESAVKKAKAEIKAEWPISFIIAATTDGRFFPVAIGLKALNYGLHHRMCVAG
jgi:hypothetical protein